MNSTPPYSLATQASQPTQPPQDQQPLAPSIPQPTHIYHLNPATGLIEVLDPLTGNLIAIQSSHDFKPGNHAIDPTQSVLVITSEGHTVELQAGAAAEYYADSPIPIPWKYTDSVVGVIAEYIASGGRITKLPPSLPPYCVIVRWRKKYPEFRQALEDAIRDRADYFQEQTMEYLEELKESGAEDRSSVARVQIDAMKWMAQTGNNDKYGNKTKLSGDPQAPLQIILDTGIRRNTDEVVYVPPSEILEAARVPLPVPTDMQVIPEITIEFTPLVSANTQEEISEPEDF